MPTYSSYSPLGAFIDSGEISSGAVTYDNLGSDVEKWKLLETLTLSGDATKTSSALTAYAKYKVVYKVINSAGASVLGFYINALNTNEYNYQGISNITPYNRTGQAYATLGTVYANMWNTGSFDIGGLSYPTAGGYLTFAVNHGQYTVEYALSGAVLAGNGTQISTFTFLVGAGTLTGTIQIYGSN